MGEDAAYRHPTATDPEFRGDQLEILDLHTESAMRFLE